MNKILSSLVASTVLIALSACSSGAKLEKKCTTTNWESEGYSDGVKGESSKHILKTQKTCAKEGYKVSVVEYKEGWLKGIEKYCSAQNGYELGLKADKKPKVSNCPVELRSNFDANYARAEKYLQTKEKIDNKEQEITKLKDSVAKLEQEKTKLIDQQSKIEASAEKVSSKSVRYDIK